MQNDRLNSFKKLVGTNMIAPFGDQQSGLALVFGWSTFEFILTESIIRKALELTGSKLMVLTQPTPFTMDAYGLMGVSRIKSYYSYSPAPDLLRAEKMLKTVKTFQDFIDLSYRDVAVGKYASSTMMRRTRRGTLDLEDPIQRAMATNSLACSLAAVEGAYNLINTEKPKLLVVVDRGYTPYGEMFDACINKNIPIVTWNVAHRDNTIMLKRYHDGNRDSHPSSLSQQSWNAIKQLKWTDKRREELYHELASSYESGEWYGEVGTQFGKKSFAEGEIIKTFGLDPERKIAVIFSHIFWDATFFWGEDLFRDYEDWFVQTVKAACKNTKLNWLIKIHPANTVKDHRDGLIGEPSEIIALREQIGELPEHVKVIPADTEVSTWSLFQAMDYCLTVRGTVGIEAGMQGKTVLTAGTGRYDHHGFTHDFETAADYLTCLQSLETISEPDQQIREMAERYAYGVFILRPLRLQTLTLGFSRDKKATMQVNCQAVNLEEFRRAHDLNDMADWLKSGNDDYLNSELMQD